MGAVREVAALVQLPQQGLNLLDGEFLARPDGSMAGGPLPAEIQGLLGVGGTLGGGGPLGDFGQQRPQLAARKKARDRFDRHRAAAEGLYLEPQLPQLRDERLQGLGLAEAQIDGLGNQERLGGLSRGPGPPSEFIVEHPLVGGVLVDQNQAVLGFADDVGIVQLADYLHPAETRLSQISV